MHQIGNASPVTASRDGDICLDPLSKGCIGDAMQHDVVEVETDSPARNKDEELIGQPAALNMQREAFLETVQKVLEARHQSCTRPLPVLLGGKEVDLLELCMQVRACGGYDKATADSMWFSISETLGFGHECGPVLKLVYLKYLKALESCTLVTAKDVKNGLLSHLPLHSSGTRMNLWVSKCAENKQYNNFDEIQPSLGIFQEENVGALLRNGEGSIQGLSELHQDRNPCEAPSRRKRKMERMHVNSPEGHLMDNSVAGRSASTSNGIDSLASVLEWIKRLALNPGDPKKGQGPRGSRQNEAWVEKCAAQVSKIRTVLWKKKELVPYGDSSLNLSKQRLPPALYYKELPKPNKQTLEKLRANQLRAMKCGFQRSASAKAYEARAISATWLCLSHSQMLAGGQYSEQGSEQPNTYLSSMNEMVGLGYLLNNKAARKRIPIGADFQAQVPPWISPAKPPLMQMEINDGSPSSPSRSCNSESTSWLGILVWPLQGHEGVVNKERIGKGRPPECSCISPASIECVKSHVLVEREKLRLELSEAFDSLGFNDMGEAVTELWTNEEESTFEELVKMNPLSGGKNFWDEVPAAFPSKSTKELVSYYFNVFVLRRRAIENRTIPESVDSDNDERELLNGEYDIYDGLTAAAGTHEDILRWKKSNIKEGETMENPGSTDPKCVGLRLCMDDRLSNMTLANDLMHKPSSVEKGAENQCALSEKDVVMKSHANSHDVQMIGSS